MKRNNDLEDNSKIVHLPKTIELVDDNERKDPEKIKVPIEDFVVTPVYLDTSGDRTDVSDEYAELLAVELNSEPEGKGTVVTTVTISDHISPDGPYAELGSYSGSHEENFDDYDHSDETSSDTWMKVSEDSLEDIFVEYKDIDEDEDED